MLSVTEILSPVDDVNAERIRLEKIRQRLAQQYADDRASILAERAEIQRMQQEFIRSAERVVEIARSL